MKNIFGFIILIICVFSNYSIGQGGGTHVVTLEVQTQQIVKPNLANFCSFGQGQNITNEDFTIEVNVGDIVRWNAVSSDAPGTDEVRITSIDHSNGSNFFGASTLGNNGQGSFVMGFVGSGNPGDIQKYSISFEVFNNGIQRNGTFVIDPKIKIKN